MLKNVGVTYGDEGSELSRLQGGVHGTATGTGAVGGGVKLFVLGQVSGFTAGQSGLVSTVKWGFPGSCRRQSKGNSENGVMASWHEDPCWALMFASKTLIN